jgi:hypothetical protein
MYPQGLSLVLLRQTSREVPRTPDLSEEFKTIVMFHIPCSYIPNVHKEPTKLATPSNVCVCMCVFRDLRLSLQFT